jgi:plasmid stabilization system protein ParE
MATAAETITTAERAMLLGCYRSALRNLRSAYYHQARLQNLKSAERCRRRLIGATLTLADYDMAEVQCSGSFKRVAA